MTAQPTQVEPLQPPPDIVPVVNEPARSWAFPDWTEFWNYRHLLFYMVYSEWRTRYKQTVLGALWAVVNPLITMVIFTFVFGRIAQVPTYDIPYPLFAYAAIVPWTLFSKGLSSAALSMSGMGGILDKVYFPRVMLPISRVFTGVIDFSLSMVILIFMMLALGYPLQLQSLWIIYFSMLALVSSLGIGLIFSAFFVRFRDIRYLVPFLLQIWQYLSPIAYPTGLVDPAFRLIYSLNPMVAIADGFRWALLGLDVVYFDSIVISSIVSFALLIAGLMFFQRQQAEFADLI